jgi:hypothetical protein
MKYIYNDIYNKVQYLDKGRDPDWRLEVGRHFSPL